MSKDNLIFIEHILANINSIESFSKNISKNDLLKDKEKQYVIIRAIERIGELLKIYHLLLEKSIQMFHGKILLV